MSAYHPHILLTRVMVLPIMTNPLVPRTLHIPRAPIRVAPMLGTPWVDRTIPLLPLGRISSIPPLVPRVDSTAVTAPAPTLLTDRALRISTLLVVIPEEKVDPTVR